MVPRNSKTTKYMEFRMYRRSYLMWPPVTVFNPFGTYSFFVFVGFCFFRTDCFSVSYELESFSSGLFLSVSYGLEPPRHWLHFGYVWFRTPSALALFRFRRVLELALFRFRRVSINPLELASIHLGEVADSC